MPAELGARADGPERLYEQFIERLSARSAQHSHAAYADVAWDDPAFAIDPHDPRWVLAPTVDPLAATEWYRNQTTSVQAEIGLNVTVDFMLTGIEFENVLQQGLLNFASTLPPLSSEFRYVYHEVTEEAQHSMMFYEFARRSPVPVDRTGEAWATRHRGVIDLAATWPELFFICVLGGEEPIDYLQRRTVAAGTHPLLERICRIHIIEEARHLSFARAYLAKAVPLLPERRLARLRFKTPFLLTQIANRMLRPSVVSSQRIPDSVLQEAYEGPAQEARLGAALRKVTGLCAELGLIDGDTRKLWRRLLTPNPSSTPRSGIATQ